MVNLPNIISLSRVPVLFLILLLLYFSTPGFATLAFILFVMGALSDWLDGFLARKKNIVSNFGKLIDALTDKIFVLGLFITLLAFQFIPVSWGLICVLLIMSREFLITGLRLVAASKGMVLAAEKTGKLKTFSQVFCIGTFLFKHMAMSDFYGWKLFDSLIPIAHWLAIITFVLATILTVNSGIVYLVKYWDLFKENT